MEKIRAMRARMDDLSPEERIHAFFELDEPSDQRFTSSFISKEVTLQSLEFPAKPYIAKATFTFRVPRYYCNASGNLHGGAQSFAYDMLTSMAMQATAGKPGGVPAIWLDGGVSRVLTVNYLLPAPEGTDLIVECEVTNAGKSLAMTRGILKRADTGAIISTCEHNKAAVKGGKPGWAKM